MTYDAQDLSNLIGQIYDAAVEPRLWKVFLESAAGSLGAGLTGLVLHDVRQNCASIVDQVRSDPASMQLYHEHYASVNPWMKPENTHFVEGRVDCGEAILPIAELRKTEFYADWGRKNGVCYSLGASLIVRDSLFAYFSVNRGEQQSPYDRSDHQLVEILAPHLRRALLLHEQLVHLRMCRGVLDQFPASVWLVDSSGRVQDMNDSAKQVVMAMDGLSVVTGRIRAAARRDQADLLAAISSIGRPRRDGFCSPTCAVAVSRPSGKPRYVLLALGSTATSAFPPAASGLVWLFASNPDRAGDAALETLSHVFVLTKAERRLLLPLLAGCSLQECADRLCLTRNTIKTQLASVYRKTGVRRHAELIRLIADFSNLHPPG